MNKDEAINSDQRRCDCGAKVGDQHLPACCWSGTVTGTEFYPSGTTFYPDGRVVLPEEENEVTRIGLGSKKWIVHITMGKAVTVYADNERDAEILALETVGDCDHASVIAVDPPEDV